MPGLPVGIVSTHGSTLVNDPRPLDREADALPEEPLAARVSLAVDFHNVIANLAGGKRLQCVAPMFHGGAGEEMSPIPLV